MAQQHFTQRVVEIIRRIPAGRVATYGGVAALAGNPRAARQVARILHSCSATEQLPWHRVINKQGCISLPPGRGFDEQRERLLEEDVAVDARGRVDLAAYLWRPGG